MATTARVGRQLAHPRRSAGVKPSASCGCTPTAAYTSGCASARATARSLDSRPTPMVTIRSTPAADRLGHQLAAGSSSQESRWAWVSTTPPPPPRGGRAGRRAPPRRPARRPPTRPRPARRRPGPGPARPGCARPSPGMTGHSRMAAARRPSARLKSVWSSSPGARGVLGEGPGRPLLHQAVEPLHERARRPRPPATGRGASKPRHAGVGGGGDLGRQLPVATAVRRARRRRGSGRSCSPRGSGGCPARWPAPASSAPRSPRR